jgi:hypothetical protein
LTVQILGRQEGGKVVVAEDALNHLIWERDKYGGDAKRFAKEAGDRRWYAKELEARVAKLEALATLMVEQMTEENQ